MLLMIRTSIPLLLPVVYLAALNLSSSFPNLLSGTRLPSPPFILSCQRAKFDAWPAAPACGHFGLWRLSFSALFPFLASVVQIPLATSSRMNETATFMFGWSK